MNQAPRDLLFRILRDASRLEIGERKRAARWPASILWWGFWIQTGLLLFALLVGLSRYAGTPAWFSNSGMFILLLYYVAVLATPVVAVSLNLRQIKEAIKNPVVINLWNAGITSTVDAKYLPLIMSQPLEEIEFVLLEVSAERNFFERRVALIVGAIEKVGILPGLAALGVWFGNLPDTGSSWGRSLAYANGILYLFGWVAHISIMRLDRMLKLLDLAVARKKAEQITRST